MKHFYGLSVNSTRTNLASILQGDAVGNIIGCIRSFHWDKHKTLPIEKIYGINPLNAIHGESKYSFWHIGRFAVAKDSGISTLTLFKNQQVILDV